jgi:hypothetical protein
MVSEVSVHGWLVPLFLGCEKTDHPGGEGVESKVLTLLVARKQTETENGPGQDAASGHAPVIYFLQHSPEPPRKAVLPGGDQGLNT